MAVNLRAPDAASLAVIPGVELGVAYAGIRKAQRNDLMLMRIDAGARVAGVFTQNSFAAAPVQLCRQHLAAGHAMRALLVNAGNANCGTGAAGLQAAQRSSSQRRGRTQRFECLRVRCDSCHSSAWPR